MREIIFTATARRDLARLSNDDRRAALEIIRAYAEGREVDAKAMRGRPGIRLKIGDHRAIVDVTRAAVIVSRVRHRSVVYRP